MSGTDNLKRYKDFIWFLYKYGRSDLFRQARIQSTSQIQSREQQQSYDPSPEAFVEDLKAMGPTFIKLGQLLSTRPDLIPAPHAEALEELQDDVGPVPFEDIQEIVESELKVRISKAFQFFNPTPLASASLGQVHLAVLHSDKTVIVKVQRPGIRKQILGDLDAFENVIQMAENFTSANNYFSLSETFSSFRRMLLRELDYEQEARNMLTIAKNLGELDNIVIPAPISDFTTSRVLTMDFISGKKVTGLSPLKLMELNGEELVKDLISAYVKMITEDGIFHADPHPGNVHLTDDNRLALIDFGMVSTIGERMQEQLLSLLEAMSHQKSEKTAECIIKMSQTIGVPNKTKFKALVSELTFVSGGTDIINMQLGRSLINLSRAAALNGYVIPPEMNVIGKTLLNLDRIASTLAPKLDPQEFIGQYTRQIIRKKLLREMKLENLGSYLLDLKSLLQRTPERLDVITQKLADGEFQLKIDAIEEKELLEGLQKIANRITLGLLIAALIIGAALLTRVQTEFQIWGYPGLAMLFFIIAALCAMIFTYNILFKDKK